MSESSYRSLLHHRGYAALLCSQFLGAYNDNLFKMVVSLLAVGAALGHVAGTSALPLTADIQAVMSASPAGVMRL